MASGLAAKCTDVGIHYEEALKEVIIVRTCSVADFDASTCRTIAVSKYTEVNTLVGS